MQQLHSATSALDAADQVLAAMPALMRFLRSQMRHRRGGGLTVPQFRALIFVNRHPQASVSALAEHIGVSNAAASRMVSLLVRNRLMVRQVHPRDRRAVTLALTARGRVQFDVAWSGMRAELADRLGALPNGELGGIRRSLRLLHELFVDEPPSNGMAARLRASTRRARVKRRGGQ